MISKWQSQPIEITRQNGPKLTKNSIAFLAKINIKKNSQKRAWSKFAWLMANGRILRDKIKGGKFEFLEKMMAEIWALWSRLVDRMIGNRICAKAFNRFFWEFAIDSTCSVSTALNDLFYLVRRICLTKSEHYLSETSFKEKDVNCISHTVVLFAMCIALHCIAQSCHCFECAIVDNVSG